MYVENDTSYRLKIHFTRVRTKMVTKFTFDLDYVSPFQHPTSMYTMQKLYAKTTQVIVPEQRC